MAKRLMAIWYRAMIVAGLLVGLSAQLIAGKAAAISALCGVVMILVMVSSWDGSTKLSMDPEHPNASLGILFILLRYGLLGALIYSMMALFVIQWAWFAIGTSVLIPSLLIANAFTGKPPAQN